MPHSNEEKAVFVSLVVLGAVIAGVPLLFVLAAAWKAGFGFNRTTIVLGLAAIALIGVFVLWLRGGAVIAPSEPNPEYVKARSLGFWGFLKWEAKRDLPYQLIGIGLFILGVLLAVAYVEYIEPYVK